MSRYEVIGNDIIQFLIIAWKRAQNIRITVVGIGC